MSSHSLGRSGRGRRRGKGGERKRKERGCPPPATALRCPGRRAGPRCAAEPTGVGPSRGPAVEGRRGSGYAPSSSPSMSKIRWVTGRRAAAEEEDEVAMARQSSGSAAGAEADAARAGTGGGFWQHPGAGRARGTFGLPYYFLSKVHFSSWLSCKTALLALRGYGVSLSGHIAELSGCSSVRCVLGWPCWSREVGPDDDPRWSLPTRPILWFLESRLVLLAGKAEEVLSSWCVRQCLFCMPV